MKAYVATSAVMFGLVALAHVMRFVAEGTSVLTNPVFALASLTAVGMVGWAIYLLRRGH
jgi:hypothetical protein